LDGITLPRPVAAAEPISTGSVSSRVGSSRKAANGPIPARELEVRARAVGLLDAGKSIGDSKPFRSARAALGVKTSQRVGVKAGGWFWELLDQAAGRAHAYLAAAERVEERIVECLGLEEVGEATETGFPFGVQ
jgi:hypothetical protein